METQEISEISKTQSVDNAIESIHSTDPNKVVSFGYEWLDEKIVGGMPGELIIVGAESGAGKCLGKGTPVMMYTGEFKKVEDIIVGDYVMSADSTKQRVLSLARGKEMMYKVTPVKGDSYIVNESHMLSLRRTGGTEIIDIKVSDYIKQHKTFKAKYKGYRVPVDFAKQSSELRIDPYFLGLWLADGDKNTVRITTKDTEVISFLNEYAEQVGLGVNISRKEDNIAAGYAITSLKRGGWRTRFSLQSEMRKEGLLGKKIIPKKYKFNSAENRAKLLAGFLDGDGHATNGCIDVVQKDKGISEEIQFIARSLGLACYTSKKIVPDTNNFGGGEYYRMTISGDFSKIPLRLQKVTRRINKNALNTGITVEAIGVGDYYGFSIGGNHRFILGDFTVTHNSTFVNNAIEYNSKRGVKCGIFALEETPTAIAKKELYFAIGRARKEDGFKNYPWRDYITGRLNGDSYFESYLDKARELLDNKNAFYQNIETVAGIDLIGDRLEYMAKNGYQFIVIDHLHYIELNVHGGDSKANYIEKIMVTLSSLIKRLQITVILVSHLRKLGGQKPNLDSFKDSSAIVQTATTVVLIWRNREEGVSNIERCVTEFIVPKTRHVGGEGVITAEYDLDTGQYHEPIPFIETGQIKKCFTFDKDV